MKRIAIVCCGLLITGCATTDQLAESNAKIQELEKKIARIEGDLYVPVKKHPPKKVNGEKVTLSDAGQKIRNDALDIKSFAGFVFDTPADELDGKRRVKLEKPIRLFTNVLLAYTSYSNRLFEVRLNTSIDHSKSFESYMDEFDKLMQIISDKYGITMNQRRDKLSSSFENANVWIFTHRNGDQFELVIQNKAVVARDLEREKAAAKKFEIPTEEGADRL